MRETSQATETTRTTPPALALPETPPKPRKIQPVFVCLMLTVSSVVCQYRLRMEAVHFSVIFLQVIISVLFAPHSPPLPILPAIIPHQFVPHSQPQTHRVQISPLSGLPGDRVRFPAADVIFQRSPELHYNLFTGPVSWRIVESQASSGLVGDQSPVRGVVVDIPAQVRGGTGDGGHALSTQGLSHNITLSQAQDPRSRLRQI